VVTFFQNNMVALLPKWVVSRSPLETTEFSFLELAESSLLYFALPFVGNQVFKPLFTKLAQKELGKAATKETAEMGVKAATILSTFGVTLVGGEFMTHYVKNLMTAKIFKKDRFSDIVNLSQGQIQDDGPSQVVQKCQKRIKQCLAACGGILGASVILAKGSASQKENIFSKLFSKPASKSAAFLTDKLSFSEKNGKLFLSKHQMRLYMGLAVFAYLDSARDKLERVETATRLALILPYLAFGQGYFENKMLQAFPAFFKPLLKNPNLKKPTAKDILSLRELADKTMAGAKHIPTQAATDFADPLKRKAVLVGAPLAFGIFGTGIGVGLLNRFWTKYRYNQQLAEQKQNQRHQPALPAAQTTFPQPAATIPAPFSVYSNAPVMPGFFTPYGPNSPKPVPGHSPISPAQPAAPALPPPLPFPALTQAAMRYPFPPNANPINSAATAYRI